MSEENLQAKLEKQRLIDLLFPSRKKDEKSLDNNVIKSVNYESTRDESLDSQLYPKKEKTVGTGKCLSEALIFASTNPQYDNRLFIELQVQYMKIPSSNLGRTYCVQKLFLTFRRFFAHMFFPCSAKRRASDKDLPVLS